MKYTMVRRHLVARSLFQRFTITVPERMAAQIESICETERQNHSEFFREVVRVYLASKSRESQFHMPMDEEERKSNPFHAFTEWDSEADRIFDPLC
jgi:Arc/MetJ-type ribon-helix-helix transcriptional regulator